MDNALPFLGIIVLAVVGIVSLAWHFSRSRSVLEQWAEENGFEILQSEYRNVA